MGALNNLKRRVIALFFIILMIISIYKIYPKKGSFNDLVLNKYSDTKFAHLSICNDDFKDCKDINKINEFLKYLKTIQLREYRGKIPYVKNDYYYIGIYAKNSDNYLTIKLQGKDFIEVCIVTDKYKYIRKKYKIMNSGLNMKYIEDFYNKYCNYD